MSSRDSQMFYPILATFILEKMKIKIPSIFSKLK